MGYHVELRAPEGDQTSLDELKRRIQSARLIVHPEYGEQDFLFERGMLSLNPPEKFQTGSWGWIRLSWLSAEEELKQALEIAEQIGARLYDASINDYVTSQNFASALTRLQAGSQWAGTILGVVESNGKAPSIKH